MADTAHGTGIRPAADITPFIPFVRGLAKRLHMRLPASVELDDLVQVGMIGLAHALARFDAGHGVKLTTYATERVRGAMLDELRAVDPLSRDDRRKLRRVELARQHAGHQLGRKPSHAETAALAELSLAEYQRLTDASSAVAVGELAPDEDPGDLAGDVSPDPFEALSASRTRAALVDAIADLPDRLQQVVSLLHVEGMRPGEVAAVLGVTPSRVSQLHRAALDALRVALVDDDSIKGA